MARRTSDLTPELMLAAFRAGLFPMAAERDADQLYWFDPEERGILPLDAFHVPRRLARTLRQAGHEIVSDRDVAGVIRLCAVSRSEAGGHTWINGPIERLFTELARRGHVHSVEVRRDDRLVGGLYGCAIGAAFFGESMFSLETDASKVAFVHLVARLRLGGFRLLDTQDVTSHLARFGVTAIPRAEYKRRLAHAVAGEARWLARPDPEALALEIAHLAGRPAPLGTDGGRSGTR